MYTSKNSCLYIKSVAHQKKANILLNGDFTNTYVRCTYVYKLTSFLFPLKVLQYVTIHVPFSSSFDKTPLGTNKVPRFTNHIAKKLPYRIPNTVDNHSIKTFTKHKSSIFDAEAQPLHPKLIRYDRTYRRTCCTNGSAILMTRYSLSRFCFQFNTRLWYLVCIALAELIGKIIKKFTVTCTSHSPDLILIWWYLVEI